MFTLKFWRLALPVMLCVLLCAQYAAAQTVTGAVSGTVLDSSGNAVAGATVKLINERTNDARVLTTSESGDFRFTAALPGIYTIKVEQKGFSAFDRRGNVLAANEHLAVGELAMKVGEMSETVTTVADGSPVQTESTEHSRPWPASYRCSRSCCERRAVTGTSRAAAADSRAGAP